MKIVNDKKKKEKEDKLKKKEKETKKKLLKPKSKKKIFTVFYKEGCPYSINTISELERLGYEYKKLVLNKDFTKDEFVETFKPECTYPRVFFGKTFIGGNDDLIEYLESLEIENDF